MPALGAPDIQHGLGATYELTAWVLLLVPGAVALVLEPVILLRADRAPRRWFVAGGLGAMALAAWGAAAAPGPITLSAAISVAWVASGTAVGLAQVVLVETYAGGRERAMTRWAMLGMLGDLAAPAVFVALAAIGLGWRAAFVGVGALALAFAIALARHAMPAPAASAAEAEDAAENADDGPDVGVWAALRDALRDRRLRVWLVALWLCDLLDETLVVFGALHLRDELGVGAVGRSLILGADLCGGVLGLIVLERLLATVAPLRLLAASAAACAVAYAAWLGAREPWLSAALMFVVGATSAPLYPLVAAQAYATRPGRGAVVAAAGHVLTPLSLALPWALGALADHAGAHAALVVLIAQPVGLLAIALAMARARARAVTAGAR